MRDKILELIDEIPTSGFFVTAEFVKTSGLMPKGIELFILQKIEAIRKGIPARKFAYKEGEWRIFFIFFPTDRVVDEKYALKNSVVKLPSKFK